ncbi:MAG TPA: chorismate mutase [Gemmatimonadaceae bacterium]|nr:chorismate mutase [Gemmatimonadaceae bacterium]
MMQSELNKLREEIERLDADIIAAIARRVQLARDIGAAKRELQLPTLDPAREAAVVRRAVGIARDAGLAFDDEIRQIFWQLIGLSRRVQQGEA